MADERPWWDIGISWEDEKKYREYKKAGGTSGINTWIKEGRPSAPMKLTYKAQQALERIGYPIPPDIRFAEPTPAEIARPLIEAEEEAAAALGQVGAGVKVPPFPTEPAPSGFRWAFDRELNRWVPQFAGLTPQQEAQQKGFPAPGEPPTDAYGRTATWSTRLGEWDYPPNWGQRPGDQPEPISPWQRQQQAQGQQQFGLQQQQFEAQQQQFQQQLAFQQQQAQMAQAEQERQYTSQLAANPMSWLQYASYTGQEPVVQPWMVPLGAQGAETSLQVGQPIPGFEGQAGQRQIQTFAGLPQLRTPSAQLQARWGPTAQAQFLGYRQARTGATPEETQFRLGAGRAPAGRFGGFSRFR